MTDATGAPRTRALSGIQPSGVVHLGNYIGAIRRWAAHQDDRDAFYMVADLHALTLPYDATALAARTRETAAALIACGLDSNRVTLFVQSDVPEHTGLCWMLMALARMGDLRRMTQFKEKAGMEQEGSSAALFAYPVLQAADVLLYQAAEVPVGDDQRQHLELVSDIARRFNNAYGETFVVPRGVMPEAGARVMDLQAPRSKMSKSSGTSLGTIVISDSDDAIRTKCMRAVTDSEQDIRYDMDAKPGISNLIQIYAALGGEPLDDVPVEFADASYGEFKTAVADRLCERFDPIRRTYLGLVSDRSGLERILDDGANRAREVARTTLAAARAAMGYAR